MLSWHYQGPISASKNKSDQHTWHTKPVWFQGSTLRKYHQFRSKLMRDGWRRRKKTIFGSWKPAFYPLFEGSADGSETPHSLWKGVLAHHESCKKSHKIQGLVENVLESFRAFKNDNFHAAQAESQSFESLFASDVFCLRKFWNILIHP